MGRRKIEMKRIEHDEARKVCFCKRRQGMFKKASELSILCGAMVAIVAFSPTGKAFSFGSPSFKAVINRFLTLENGESCDSSSGEANTTKESLECSELEQLIESEKKRKEMLKEILEGDMDGRVMDWLSAKSYLLRLDDLQEFHTKLVAIQDVVKEKIKQVLQEERHPTRPYPPAFMALASKYMLDRQARIPISSMAPNSNIGLADGPDVNDYSASSIYAVVGTSLDCPSNQVDG
ncbi:unnamed protein product [Urochloa decumbens]|uniref:MADS-box domain-containing protein n=1 Tax=Urochloa decumbens TaxID=240449 RepID=A0ABC8Z7K8_9POAL